MTMRLFYTAAYWIGFRPWEMMASLPIHDQVLALFAREESGGKPPFGRVLDLGCGTGIWSVKLAARGWQVTGIDIVAKAVRTAHRRVRDAGVDVQLVHGNITALRTAGVGSGFRFVLDLGAVHGLDDSQRTAVGREVSAVTSNDATLLIAAWAPARRGPLPRGASRGNIEATFPDWTVIAEEACDVSGAPNFVKRADPRFYRLRRNRS
jgi:SAM-dependent methyltransferase